MALPLTPQPPLDPVALRLAQTALFRRGLAAQLTLVLLISTGAYLGLVPTVFPSAPHFDLVGHFMLIGLLAFFTDGALAFRRIHPALAFPRAGALLVLAVAGIEEYAQRFSSRRSSDWLDFAADTLGVLAFSYLAGRVGGAATPVPTEASAEAERRS